MAIYRACSTCTLQDQGAGKAQTGADGAPKLEAKPDSTAADSKAAQDTKAAASTGGQPKEGSGADTGVDSPALTVRISSRQLMSPTLL